MNPHARYGTVTEWISEGRLVASATMHLGQWITDYWDGDEFVVVGYYGDDREAAERHAEALYLSGVWKDN